MNRTRAVWCLFGSIVLVAASAFARGATPKELVVTLKFVPQEGVTSNTANLPPSMLDKSVEIRVKDHREQSDALVVGTGTGGDDKSFPIRADHDVMAYVKETVETLAKGWGLKPATHADRILVIDVTRFSIDESNKALGSVYTSEVKLAYTLKSGGGSNLAEGVGSGGTHRYGRAHSAENINEVLSDALKEAFANVVNDSTLQSAWSGKKK